MRTLCALAPSAPPCYATGLAGRAPSMAPFHGEYLGKLIRTGGAGPIWANEDLRYALGTPFTFDGHTNAACAEVERILQERART